MKLLTANQKIANKIPIAIEDLTYIKSMTPLKELLDGGNGSQNLQSLEEWNVVGCYIENVKVLNIFTNHI